MLQEGESQARIPIGVIVGILLVRLESKLAADAGRAPQPDPWRVCPNPEPWRSVVAQFVQAAVAKDLAGKLEGALKGEVAKSADGAINKLLDDYCGNTRASNFTVPTTPTLRPKLRKVARRSFSMAMAFDCSSLR